MKKLKLVAAGLFVCSAALVGYKAYDNTTSQQQLLLQNVEALATAEAQGGEKCFNTITTSEGKQARYCGNCEFIPGEPALFSGSSRC